MYDRIDNKIIIDRAIIAIIRKCQANKGPSLGG